MMDDIQKLVGRIPVSIHQDNADDQITFTFSDGSTAKFYHSQDCCETVEIEDVNGNWDDLLNNPLLVAEERISTDEPSQGGESETWTFYTFRGIGGSVDVRWYGTSNGYYSESVDMDFTEAH